MSVKVEGVGDTVFNLNYLLNAIDSGVDKAIRVGALSVEATAVKKIQRGTKTGNIYTRGSITHQSSAEGEAPATDTGALVKSIAAVKAIGGSGDWLVGSNLKYASYLEFGTTDMKPRPWINPSLEQNRRHIEALIKKALRKEL